jgi:hypothetical protein
MVAMSLLSVVSVTNVGSGTSGGGGCGRLNGLRIAEVYRHCKENQDKSSPTAAAITFSYLRLCADGPPLVRKQRGLSAQKVEGDSDWDQQFIGSFTIAPMTNLASPNTQIVSKSLYKKHT